MLYNFPSDKLKPPKNHTIDCETRKFYSVEYEFEDEDSGPSIAHSQEVLISEKALLDENETWNSGAYMKILSWIRKNIEIL
jgi:hypothetical protein